MRILTLGLGSFSDVNHLVTLGYGSSTTPIPPTPTPSPQGSGGGYSRSFGYYPEVNREILSYKKKIEVKVKKREKIEQRMSFALNSDQLTKLLSALNVIQKQIDLMVQRYEKMISLARQRNQLLEEEEVLTLIV